MTPRRQPRPVPQNLREILAAQVQALQSPYRYYRVAAHRFLAYLQSDFPDLRRISELRRDPHLLGWIRGLCQQDPPLSNYTRRIYITGIRRLLRDLAPEDQPGLILPEDFPPHPRRHPDRPSPAPHPCQEFFDAHIQIFATTLRPSTVHSYRLSAHRFLAFRSDPSGLIREEAFWNSFGCSR